MESSWRNLSVASGGLKVGVSLVPMSLHSSVTREPFEAPPTVATCVSTHKRLFIEQGSPAAPSKELTVEILYSELLWI